MAEQTGHMETGDAFLHAAVQLDFSAGQIENVRQFLIRGGLGEKELWLRMARSQVAPLVYSYLCDAGLLGLLDPVHREWLAEEFGRNSLIMALYRREALGLTKKLAEAGIPVMWLKGLWLASFVYERPALRMMEDIDLLVPKGRFSQALDVLGSIGCEPSLLTDADGPGPHATQLVLPRPQWGPGRHLTVDLHHEISPTGEGGWCTELAWNRARMKTESGAAIHEPGPEAGILLIALHLLNHAYEPRYRLKSMADMAAVLRRYQDSIDWDVLARDMEEPAVPVSLSMLFSLFGQNLVHEKTKAFSALCAARVRDFGIGPLTERILSLSGPMRSIGMHDTTLIMLGRQGGILKVSRGFFSRLFSGRRLERHSVLEGKRGSGRVAGFLRWVALLPKMNWRYLWVSFLTGRLLYIIHRIRPARAGRRNAGGGPDAAA